MSQINSAHTLPIYLFRSNIILTLTPGSWEWSLSSSYLHPYSFLLSVIRVTCPIILTLSGMSTKHYEVPYWNFLQLSVTSFFLGQNNSLSTRSSTNRQIRWVCVRPPVWGSNFVTRQNSRQNYILAYFNFLGLQAIDRMSKDYEPNVSKNSQNFICFYVLDESNFDLLLSFPNIWILPYLLTIYWLS